MNQIETNEEIPQLEIWDRALGPTCPNIEDNLEQLKDEQEVVPSNNWEIEMCGGQWIRETSCGPESNNFHMQHVGAQCTSTHSMVQQPS